MEFLFSKISIKSIPYVCNGAKPLLAAGFNINELILNIDNIFFEIHYKILNS